MRIRGCIVGTLLVPLAAESSYSYSYSYFYTLESVLEPSASPTVFPGDPTALPIPQPTAYPIPAPTVYPGDPTALPIPQPTPYPIPAPTVYPGDPTALPVPLPTTLPIPAPTVIPGDPSALPVPAPTLSAPPSAASTPGPTMPTPAPTLTLPPTPLPSPSPTRTPMVAADVAIDNIDCSVFNHSVFIVTLDYLLANATFSGSGCVDTADGLHVLTEITLLMIMARPPWNSVMNYTASTLDAAVTDGSFTAALVGFDGGTSPPFDARRRRLSGMSLAVVTGVSIDTFSPSPAPSPAPSPGPTPTPIPAPTIVTCTNDFIDGNETDIDCGGPFCTPCALGKNCSIDRDCFGGGICVLSPTPAPSVATSELAYSYDYILFAIAASGGRCAYAPTATPTAPAVPSAAPTALPSLGSETPSTAPTPSPVPARDQDDDHVSTQIVLVLAAVVTGLALGGGAALAVLAYAKPPPPVPEGKVPPHITALLGGGLLAVANEPAPPDPLAIEDVVVEHGWSSPERANTPARL